MIFQTENGNTKLDVHFQDETVLGTQKLMAELFQTSVPNINMHLKNVFEECQLEENRTIKDFLIVQKEGNREVKKATNIELCEYKYEKIKNPADTQPKIIAILRAKMQIPDH